MENQEVGRAADAEDQPRGRERPSAHGAVLGGALAALAEAGRAAKPCLPDMCATCAFRPGTMTNLMAATGLEAFKCSIGADSAVFGCHHGLLDGEPTKLCSGWLAAREAPFSAVKAISAQLKAGLDAIAGHPDAIRTMFDAWIAEVDPDSRMNDYERGRAYLRANPIAKDQVE